MYKIITTNSTFTVPKDTVVLSFTGDKTPEALIQARKVLRKMAGGIANDIALILDGNIIATIKHRFVGRFYGYTTVTAVKEAWQHV